MKIFRHGLQLPDYKALSLTTPHLKKATIPKEVVMPLLQHQGLPAIPIIKIGEHVHAGTKIAVAQGDFSANVHAGISGKITHIHSKAIVICSDGKDTWDPSIEERPHWRDLAPDAIRRAIFDAGIVGMGGHGFPTHLKLTPGEEGSPDVLLINGCESEPFMTADYILMFNRAVEILNGSCFLLKASGAKRCVIAIEDNKLDCIELLLSKIHLLKFRNIEVKRLPTRYPQGFEAELIRSSFGPNEPLDSKPLVLNVATAYAVYEAVRYRKPLVERVVSITGHCVVQPKNLLIRLGTSALDLIQNCKGFLRDPDRVVLGGPMSGVSVTNLHFPMTKVMNGIVALANEFVDEGEESSCIRCGLCVEVCPEHLVPETLVRAIRHDDHEVVQDFDLEKCIECGNCTFICPSKIPLLEVLRQGKEDMLDQPTLRDRSGIQKTLYALIV